MTNVLDRMIAAVKVYRNNMRRPILRDKTIPDPIIVKQYLIKTVYMFDENSPQHKLAEESLVYVSTERGLVKYTDDGILSNKVYFDDLCRANAKDIEKYENEKLKRRNLTL